MKADSSPDTYYYATVVIILWIWIIYNKSKRVLAVMLTLFCGEITGVLFILVKALPDFEGTALS